MAGASLEPAATVVGDGTRASTPCPIGKAAATGIASSDTVSVATAGGSGSPAWTSFDAGPAEGYRHEH